MDSKSINYFDFFEEEMNCLSWVVKAWEEVGSSGIVSKAREVGMLPDPGLEVEGYVERSFADATPDVAEADVYIAELERDFENDE